MKYERYAWRLAHRYYNPRSIHDRDDLFQTAMLGLVEQTSRHPESSEAVLITAMKCAVLRLYIREMRCKRQAKVQTWDDGNPEIKHLKASEDTERTVFQAEARQAITRAVDMLPSEERHFFLLRANGANLSAEVRKNGWRHSTVKWRLLQARQHLQEWLTEAGVTA